jgi:hypothetical protein
VVSSPIQSAREQVEATGSAVVDPAPFPLAPERVDPDKHEHRPTGRSHQWLPAGLRWPQWYVRRIAASRAQRCTCQESPLLLTLPAGRDSSPVERAVT